MQLTVNKRVSVGPVFSGSRKAILDAIIALHAAGETVCRSLLISTTGLSGSVVKDQVDALIDLGAVRRPTRNVYVPVRMHPAPRSISRTILDDGVSILEIGDLVIHLTPPEARKLGQLYASDAQDHAAQTLIEELRSFVRPK
jgi:hypothetical protein